MRIAALVRQHVALRTLPRWLLLTTVTSLLMEGVRATLGQRLAPAFAGRLLAAAVLWLPLTAFLLATAFKPRCGEWHLALPLPARRLRRAHLAAFALAGAAVLGLAALAAAVHDRVLLSHAPATIRGGVGEILPAAVACLLCAVACLAARSPARQRVEASPAEVAWGIAVAAGAILATAALSLLPAAALAAPLGLALLVSWRAERALPKALEPATGSRRPAPARDGGQAAAAGGWRSSPSRPARGATALLVFRVMSARGSLFVMLPVLVVYGMLLAGGIGVLTGDHAERAEGDVLFAVWALLTIFLLVTPLPKQLRGLHQLDALPLSRRFLFAVMILPGLVATVAGYVTGAILAARAAGPAAATGAALVAPAVWHPCAAVFVLVPYLLLAAAVLRFHAPGIGVTARRVGVIALQGLAVGSGLVVLGLGIGEIIDMPAATLALERLAAAVGAAAPGGAATVWLLAGAALVAVYRLAESRFQRAEAPPESLRATSQGCF
jgi:hypothetical protein